jgi:hypothetical protein
MKKILLSLIVSTSLIACTSTSKDASITGVYNLDKEVIKTDGKDSAMNGSGFKIYTATHYLWANLGADSTVNFSFGSYVLNGDSITRTSIYSSTKLDTTNVLTYSFKTNEKGYSQIVSYKNAAGKESQMIEDYSTLATNTPASSDLEGAWKQVNTTVIEKKDTLNFTNIQYKVFQNGYFMFVRRYATDSTQKTFKCGFGTGKYTYNNGNLEEVSDLTSSQKYKGVKFKIAVKFNGEDEYSQSISDSTKTYIETYSRIK